MPSEVYGSIAPEDAIYDDDEFAMALAAGGNVYLAMYYRHSPPGRSIAGVRRTAEAVFDADPLADIDTFRLALPYDPGQELAKLYAYYRMRHFLRGDFALTRDELAKRLNTPPDELERYFGEVKRLVAREVVAAILRESPQATWPQVHAVALPGEPIDAITADREDLLRAYRSNQAIRVAVDRQVEVPDSLRGRIEQGWDVTAPVDKLARAARRVGFVTFEKDPDGVMRRIPLVIDVDGHLVKQLGFAVACDLLGFDDGQVRLQGDNLILADALGRNTVRVPIGPDGCTLPTWHIDRQDPDWQHSFNHLPVSAVMEIVDNRRAIEENLDRLAIKRARAVELTTGDAYAQYAANTRRRNLLRRQLHYLTVRDTAEAQATRQELDQLAELIATADFQAIQYLQLTVQQLMDLPERSADEDQLLAELRPVLADLQDEESLAEVERLNAGLQARNAELIDQLCPLVQDKVCFVGYTAAAVADMVNTPVFKNTPGVLAHANVVNSFLTHRFPRLAPPWMNVLLILLSGAVVTFITASRGPWVSLVSVLLLVPLILAGASVLFAARLVYVAAIVASITVFVGWAFITLYRQLVEQQAKRQFSRALAQYTSPAVAAQIAEETDPQDLAPHPGEVTCFFSDLKGFTAISERLGAARTRSILNPYLEAMSQVLIDHKAIINKFMGDGIFAFFNPPILPCPDHCRSACQAALDSLTALQRLKADHAGGPLGADVDALHMRVGVSSGSVFVGDYGSVNKLDYTCIGDVVNLAARLESANKVFGTQIVISEATRSLAGDGFVLRPLGRIQVVGKQEALPVYELLGRQGQVDDQQLRYADAFAKMVDQFSRRHWDEAVVALGRCTDLRSDDPAADLYHSQIDQFRHKPPPDDWNQSIELTSK